jgi:hypothetical protein
MFANGVLMRIFGPKGVEVVEVWRNLHNGYLHKFGSSTNIIRMITSRRMRWTGYVVNMETRNAYRILVGKLE